MLTARFNEKCRPVNDEYGHYVLNNTLRIFSLLGVDPKVQKEKDHVYEVSHLNENF